jgi:hypothetical protein
MPVVHFAASRLIPLAFFRLETIGFSEKSLVNETNATPLARSFTSGYDAS